MELRLILTELLTRIPDVTLAGEPERLVSNFIGGIKHMPVAWAPGVRAEPAPAAAGA
jgi:cytochrome P450